MAAPRIHTDLDAAKQALRRQALAARVQADPLAAGQALAGHVLRDCPPPPDAVVSAFWPLGQEIDLRPLMGLLHARGNLVVLPITPKRGSPLTFGLWQPGDSLVPERFGTFRPTGVERAPTFLLVPLLAFDLSGNRLGYGAGYYDRTLAALGPHFALGCAFANQQVDSVPVGPYDARLDAVATENGVIRFGG